MPCYNCAATVEEAISSLYQQGLKIPFEVIMVDDGSKDGTASVLRGLSEKFHNIRIISQKENRGAGNARNVAVENSEAELIFNMDSDDILPSETLPKMLCYLKEENCDGVGIAQSIKFRRRNPDDTAYINTFHYIGERIPFESLFDGFYCSLNCPTFLYTKKAFTICEGYPTHHGFDTQGFAFRFLANGLNAHTCPDTSYLHRIKFHRSYYLREYEEGKIGHNIFKLYEEFLYLFNTRAKDVILNHDLNDYANPLSAEFADQNWQFDSQYKQMLQPYSKQRYAETLKKRNDYSKYDHYWLASEAYRKANFSIAANEMLKAIEKGMKNDHAFSKAFHSICMIHDLRYQNVHESIVRLYAYNRKGSLLPIPLRLADKCLSQVKRRISREPKQMISSY